MIVRDTNLGPPFGGLPQATMLHFYEPPLLAMLRRTRAKIADMIEGTARELGLEDFRSSVRVLRLSARDLHGSHARAD